jgi:hypothetical protein
MDTVILYNKANEFGLMKDAELLKAATKGILKDPLEPANWCDCAIHLEVPYYSWMSFARVNIFVINPEWWEDVWNPYLKRVDILVFKCETDRERFCSTHPIPLETEVYVVPWAAQGDVVPKRAAKPENTCLWLLGGSVNKRAAARHILPLWKDSWPKLQVYTTTSLDISGTFPPNVTLTVENLGDAKRKRLQAAANCHLIFSAAEALCVSAAEAELNGAFILGNSLPTYLENFNDPSYTHLVPSTLEPFKGGMRDTFTSLTQETLETAIQAFLNGGASSSFMAATSAAIRRRTQFSDALKRIMQSKKFTSNTKPQITLLRDEDLPPISVLTLLYNRKTFIDLAFHNILTTDYPKDKIEWVIVDDSDIAEEQASDKILKFGREASPLSMTYIPLSKRTIGRKRNVGINRCQHDIVLCMDDDDHYPVSSFRRRVSALLTHSWKPQAAVCSTIACYNLMHGTSAVNTPPWSLPLRQRVSEATFVFYKKWWEAKNFPNSNVAEGEEFLEGREEDVLELQPQQIIVAMSHSKNSTSRRGAAAGQPSCFWGFPKEFLAFLHKLVGIEIEE